MSRASTRIRLGVFVGAAFVLALWAALGGTSPGGAEPPVFVAQPTSTSASNFQPAVTSEKATPETTRSEPDDADGRPPAKVQRPSGNAAKLVSGDAEVGEIDSVPHGVTLQLSEPLPPSVRPAECPKRYLFVNTHTYGRHHNQLQEMLNLVSWAPRLNRTAVIGWFRHNHKWSDPSEFYDFSEIQRRFCVVTPKEMEQGIASSGTASTAECFGQGFVDTPLKRFMGRTKCRNIKGIPRYYNTRNGQSITRGYLPRIESSTATVAVLSGQVGFFFRPGLAANAAVFRYLRPNAAIEAEINAFQKRTPTLASDGPGFFGLHLRQREKECMKEVVESFEDGESVKKLPMSARRVIETQCAMTVPHVKALEASLGLDASSPKFLASDHQNKKLEDDLVAHGAKLYEGGKFHTKEMGGLQGMAVDFFMLTKGKYFTGNQLSSITQNACFVRLGNGLGCHGFIPAFTQYHARDLADEPMPPPTA